MGGCLAASHRRKGLGGRLPCGKSQTEAARCRIHRRKGPDERLRKRQPTDGGPPIFREQGFLRNAGLPSVSRAQVRLRRCPSVCGWGTSQPFRLWVGHIAAFPSVSRAQVRLRRCPSVCGWGTSQPFRLWIRGSTHSPSARGVRRRGFRLWDRVQLQCNPNLRGRAWVRVLVHAPRHDTSPLQNSRDGGSRGLQ